MNDLVRWLFRLVKYERDAKAIARGRIGQRLWNRLVSTLLRTAGRKSYR